MKTLKPTEADVQIASAIHARASLLIDAGAGSGKTWSLVNGLLLIKEHYRSSLVAQHQRVACITFTNVAKNEIAERTEFDELFEVRTIHEFLWDQIKNFQKELVEALVVHNSSLSANSRRRVDPDELQDAIHNFEKIDYSDSGPRFLEGQIHHDDLLAIAAIVFEQNPFLARLTGAQYPFIFVDEYQDTSPFVIEILLDRIREHAPNTMIAFFGDKAQSIYRDGIGELSDVHQKKLKVIKKGENYRCAKAVIQVLNKLRTDIQQKPAGNNVDGAVVYVGLAENEDARIGYGLATDRLDSPPDFEDAKALYLTHRLIASRAGYGTLHNAYRGYGGYRHEQFEKGEEPVARLLAFQLDRLAECWAAGDQGQALDLIPKVGFDVSSQKQKAELSDRLKELVDLVSKDVPISELVGFACRAKLVEPIDRLTEGFAIAEKDESAVAEEDKRIWSLFRALGEIPCSELRTYRNFIDENTPYSTKHGVKGDEFDTVVVVLDDKGANWNLYAFGNLIVGKDSSEARLKRTRNLLYVCLSRARKNLVVVEIGYQPERRSAIEELFGPENVIISGS